MVADMSYQTVSNVVESWESLRRIENYEEVAGVILFRKFFMMEPDAAEVFSFGKHTTHDDELYKSTRLRQHAKYYMKMVDKAIGLLGPDIELLTDILMDLGEKHANFGVKPSYYAPMGQALINTMEELLGDKFTRDVKNSWLETYEALAYDMVKATHGSQQYSKK